MPIGKDSIQKRVAKNTTTEQPTPVTQPVVEETKPVEPAKPATQKKTTSTQKKSSTTTTKKKSTSTTTTAQKKPTTRKTTTQKPPEPTTTEPITTIIANISPEVVEKVVGHEEGQAAEHIQIGKKLPTYLL